MTIHEATIRCGLAIITRIKNPANGGIVQILKTGLIGGVYETLLILQPTDFDSLTETSCPAVTSLIASFK